MNFKELKALRPDLAFIAHWVKEGAHVLDVGCGDGAMLRYLELDKRCTATASRSPTTRSWKAPNAAST